MSAEHEPKGRHAAIEAAAADFFARRESGEWKAGDDAELSAWFAASPLHRVAYLRLEHVWERAERLRVLRTPDGSVPAAGNHVFSPFFTAAKAKSRTRRPRWSWHNHRAAWSVAAGLAAVLIVNLAWLLWPQASVYRTPVGGLETVPLSDGSVVTLNTDSAIRVAVTPQERRVTLERGEAFFEIAKDPRRPFVVEAGGNRVVAVGTQFSVWRDMSGSGIQVVVTEGTVRLEGAAPEPLTKASSGRAAPHATRSAMALLPAGTVAHAGDAGILVKPTSSAEAEQALSWRQGILVFHDTTLAAAIADFNRYNVRQVVIEDPQIASLKVAGSFRATNIEAFMRLLEKGYPIRAEERDGKFVLDAR